MLTRPATGVAAKGLRDNPRTIYYQHHQYLLVNWCLPKPWKHALISPLLKKAGLDEAAPANFRPVSNLPFLSKLLERVVHGQLAGYLNSHKLLSEFQSAYRHGHSTETAVLEMFSDIVDATDLGKLALLSLLDRSCFRYGEPRYLRKAAVEVIWYHWDRTCMDNIIFV